MINPAKLFKLKSAWNRFTQNHPKFPRFLNAIHSTGLEEGTIIEISITNASGKTISSNLKLSQSDIELFHELSDLANGM